LIEKSRAIYPFDRKDRAARYRYALSILQAEFALTRVLDRPVMGRVFFEQVIRENLDLGRPGQVQLIFDRRVSRRTPGRFRTRLGRRDGLRAGERAAAQCWLAWSCCFTQEA
jgi:hypothetical protein